LFISWAAKKRTKEAALICCLFPELTLQSGAKSFFASSLICNLSQAQHSKGGKMLHGEIPQFELRRLKHVVAEYFAMVFMV